MKPNTEVSHNFTYRLQKGKKEKKKGGGGERNLAESFTVYHETPAKARICKH